MTTRLIASQPWQEHYLPPPDTLRWTASKKQKVVTALNAELVTDEYVTKLYNLSGEELQIWKTAYETRGLRGLKVTKIPKDRTK